MSAYVEFRNVKKTYKSGEIEVHALNDVNFEINKGEFCVIVGASGAGKTTILNILGGMDTLTEGQVFLDGTEISALNKRKLTAYRRYDVGYVFQFYNLVQRRYAVSPLTQQRCSDRWAFQSVQRVFLRSSRAVSSSVWQLQEHLPRIRSFCSVTSLQVLWTTQQVSRYFSYCRIPVGRTV